MSTRFRIDVATVDDDYVVHVDKPELGYSDYGSHALEFADMVEQIQGERALTWLREPYGALDPDEDPPTDDDCFAPERILDELDVIEDHAKQHPELYPVRYSAIASDSATGQPAYPHDVEIDGCQFKLILDWNRCEAVEGGATRSPRRVQLSPGEHRYRIFPPAADAIVVIKAQSFLEYYRPFMDGVRRVCTLAADQDAQVFTSAYQ
jgi:hypothetical protein